MIAAELIEQRHTALQAQFVSLAVKRKIRLLGYPVVDADTADYAVQLTRSDTGLEPWEQAVVDALFGPGAAVGAARDLQRYGDSELADALRPIVDALPGSIPGSGFEGERVASKGGGWFVLGCGRRDSSRFRGCSIRRMGGVPDRTARVLLRADRHHRGGGRRSEASDPEPAGRADDRLPARHEDVPRILPRRTVSRCCRASRARSEWTRPTASRS